MCLHCLRSTYDFFGDKLGQNLTETLRISYDNRKVIVQSSCYLHDFPIKSQDARTMALRKSQGVRMLTVQLSCNYVHGFKRPSMFIFGLQKSCDHKSCYEEASVLVEHGPKVWNSVIRLCIF